MYRGQRTRQFPDPRSTMTKWPKLPNGLISLPGMKSKNKARQTISQRNNVSLPVQFTNIFWTVV
jgi:hypothetical protein